MPPKRAYGKLTQEQEKALNAWTHKPKAARISIRALAKKIGVHYSRLSRKIAKRKAGTSLDHLRCSTKLVQKEFVAAREAAASAGSHRKVTSKEVSRSLQVKTRSGRKFKTPSRVSHAVRGSPELRDPTMSPLNGDLARNSRTATYLLHHTRV